MTETLEMLTRSAVFTPSSYDAEARTIIATIATDADVQRSDSRGPFIERLDTAVIDPGSLIGTVVLDGHRRDGSAFVVGTVVESWREGRDIAAKMRLSAADDVRSVVLKVAEGILRGCSIGYAVTRWTETTQPPKTRVRTATAWAIQEVSLVGIPADARSQIRSEAPMTTPNVAEQEAPQIQTPAAPQGETRAALNATIRSMAEVAGLDRAWADAQIDGEATVDAARAAAFTAMSERSAPGLRIRPHVGTDYTDPTVIVERQAEALACRMSGATPSEPARQYAEMGFADYARDALVRSGTAITTFSREGILERAMHTTSDFPLLLDQASNRVVMSAYALAESPLKALARRRVVNDLRNVVVMKVGEVSALEKVTEAGEITSATLGEAAEGYAIDTYGKILTLSRKLLINDDLSIFGQAAALLGQGAAQTEANALVGLLTQASGAGPVMSDGERLFSVDHGNIAASGSIPSIEALSAARIALRTQKAVDGLSPVAITPRYWVVGPEMETEAEQMLTVLNAATAADANPFAGKLSLIVEPRIVGSAWYLFGDPSTAPVLEMAYLASAAGPQVISREGWQQLAREYRVTLDLGVGAVDHRGVYRNAGA